MPASRLNPVTLASELAREAPARGSSPRWPTNMTDTSWTTFCRMQLATSGPARLNSRLASAMAVCSGRGTSRGSSVAALFSMMIRVHKRVIRTPRGYEEQSAEKQG